jgi:hypothetical protein
MTGPDESTMAAAFAEIGDLAPLPAFKHPPMDRLPYIGYDIIHRLLGINLHDEDMPMIRKAAAAEWFWRRAAGQAVTFDQVMRGGSITNTEVPPDPTRPPAPSGSG